MRLGTQSAAKNMVHYAQAGPGPRRKAGGTQPCHRVCWPARDTDREDPAAWTHQRPSQGVDSREGGRPAQPGRSRWRREARLREPHRKNRGWGSLPTVAVQRMGVPSHAQGLPEGCPSTHQHHSSPSPCLLPASEQVLQMLPVKLPVKLQPGSIFGIASACVDLDTVDAQAPVHVPACVGVFTQHYARLVSYPSPRPPHTHP